MGITLFMGEKRQAFIQMPSNLRYRIASCKLLDCCIIKLLITKQTKPNETIERNAIRYFHKTCEKARNNWEKPISSNEFLAGKSGL